MTSTKEDDAIKQNLFTPNIGESTIPELEVFSIPATIQVILETAITTHLSQSPFIFERSSTAATRNSLILEENNFSFEEVIKNSPFNSSSYGSEFRDVTLLEMLLHRHHHWPIIKDIICNGASYPLSEISDEERLLDINFFLERGNHQSSIIDENNKALQKSFDKEVMFEWAIPFHPHVIKLIPEANITPLGVAVQWTVDRDGHRVKKRRTTHDCSFPGPSLKSCNNRVIEELLPQCRFGHALLRFLHGIHSLRLHHPSDIIGMSKTDMDAAYRRLHANFKSAASHITVLDNIAYFLGRLPFGSSPAPSLFSVVSDAIGDVAQDLICDESWDPFSLCSQFEWTSFDPSYEDPSIPFSKADPLSVDIPYRKFVTDNYIDDLFQAGIILENNDCLKRLQEAVPLVLDAIFRPVLKDDDCLRNPIISETKHIAEGRIAEVKPILGWIINTRQFRVYLDKHKHDDWVRDIDQCITTGMCTYNTLDSTIGRFNHTCVIIHLGRFFCNRLRFRLSKFEHLSFHEKKFFKIKLAPWELADLELWRFFLTSLKDSGISINNICHTQPSSVVWSDACEWGIGGYTLQGHLWRWVIPEHLRLRASINLLEFIAAVITIELSIREDVHRTEFPHILSFTDSSSALGWLYHSNFNPVTHPGHDKVARYLARLLFRKEASLYKEHITGIKNWIADSCSRDIHLDDANLIKLFHFALPPSQVPSSLRVVPIPKTTVSWLLSLLESMTPSSESPPVPSPSKLVVLSGFNTSSDDVQSGMSSSTRSHSNSTTSSWSASPIQLDSTGISPLRSNNWSDLQSKPPSHTWFRHSEITYGRIPPPISKESDAQFSSGN